MEPVQSLKTKNPLPKLFQASCQVDTASAHLRKRSSTCPEGSTYSLDVQACSKDCAVWARSCHEIHACSDLQILRIYGIYGMPPIGTWICKCSHLELLQSKRRTCSTGILSTVSANGSLARELRQSHHKHSEKVPNSENEKLAGRQSDRYCFNHSGLEIPNA